MSVNKVFDVDLDIKRPSSHRDFTVVNGDNGNRINVTLMDGDSPVDLTGCRIIAAFSRADGSTSLQDSGVQNGGITISPDDASKVAIDPFSRLVLSRCCGMRASGILRRFPFYPRHHRPLQLYLP